MRLETPFFRFIRNKSPGPEGFLSEFFKKCWDIVEEDFCLAIEEFFQSSTLLREMNSTSVALIPKIDNATKVGDYHPISLCNVIYKIITKILANRMKKVVGFIVGPEQEAFVQGKHISDNILLAYKLVRKYNRLSITSRACLKIDIRKAFDSVTWSFLREALLYFGLPKIFVNWIMECVSTSMFSILVNGEPAGYFQRKRGLRQGDPLSPYLFVLSMEILSRHLRSLTKPKFSSHPKCPRLKLNHLVLADDLLIFTRGDLESVTDAKKKLDSFAECSGLCANPSKTGIYCGEVKEDVLMQILDYTSFVKEDFAFRYLGVPLNSSLLTVKLCYSLLDKIAAHTSR